MQEHQPALLTPAEAAAALRVSTSTLKGWVRNGKLQAVVLPGGGHRRYRREDIERIAAGEAVA